MDETEESDKGMIEAYQQKSLQSICLIIDGPQKQESCSFSFKVSTHQIWMR